MGADLGMKLIIHPLRRAVRCVRVNAVEIFLLWMTPQTARRSRRI